MGTLVAMHYPTEVFFDLADHTYVECGTGGKAWACWGGSTGGKTLRTGVGSTARANAIAGPDGKAGVTCYLINGVCHQAANRILLPAGLTVRGARGYWLSSALFGTYGRQSAFGCYAPFNQYPEVSGDLPECMEGPAPAGLEKTPVVDDAEQLFLERQLELSTQQEQLVESGVRSPSSLTDIQLEMFAELVRYRLRDTLAPSRFLDLMDVRAETERKQVDADAMFAANDLSVGNLVRRKNALTLEFQSRSARLLDESEYRSLFACPKSDMIVLGDPEIADRAYRNGPTGPRLL